jgi:hypothetical protein
MQEKLLERLILAIFLLPLQPHLSLNHKGIVEHTCEEGVDRSTDTAATPTSIKSPAECSLSHIQMDVEHANLLRHFHNGGVCRCVASRPIEHGEETGATKKKAADVAPEVPYSLAGITLLAAAMCTRTQHATSGRRNS